MATGPRLSRHAVFLAKWHGQARHWEIPETQETGDESTPSKLSLLDCACATRFRSYLSWQMSASCTRSRGFLSFSIELSLFFMEFLRKIITFTWYTYFRSDALRVLAICHRIYVLCKHWRGRGSSAHPWPRCWQSLNKCYQWCSQRGL